MTLDETLMAIMRTYPVAPVEIRQENTRAFRAGFGNDWDSALTSEWRETPELAVRRFHEKLVARAKDGHTKAKKHLDSLECPALPEGDEP